MLPVTVIFLVLKFIIFVAYNTLQLNIKELSKFIYIYIYICSVMKCIASTKEYILMDCLYMYMCMCIYLCVCIYIYIYIYACLYECMYECMYVLMYDYIYVLFVCRG